MERVETKIANSYLFFEENCSKPVYTLENDRQTESFLLCALHFSNKGIIPAPGYRFTGKQVAELIELKKIYFVQGDNRWWDARVV